MSKPIQPNIQQLHYRFQVYGRNAREWMRRCALLLPEIEHERVWEKKGFESIYVYAGKLAGMSHASVDDALRILDRIKDKPALQKVVEEKGLNAVRPVIAIATIETEAFWAEKAKSMSKNTLEVYVKEFRTSTENMTENQQQEAIDKITLAMELQPDTIAQLEKLKGKDGDWEVLMQELLEAREKLLEQEKPEPVQTASRHIPNKIQRHVKARTNGICSFRNCTKSVKILHHTQRFALEQIHDPDQIEPLCIAHERIVHHGLIEDESIPASEWKVRTEANPDEAKYKIDQMVQKYRRSE